MATPEVSKEIKNFFNQLPLPVVLLALPAKTIAYVNPAFVNEYQAIEETLLHQPFSQFFNGSRPEDETSSQKIEGTLQLHDSESKAVTVLQSSFEALTTAQSSDTKPNKKKAETTYQLLIIQPTSNNTSLERAHRDFLSTVSHEFRTPLTSIKGFADTLLSYGNQIDPEQQKRFIRIIREQADRLIRMVEALLDVSKSDRGKLDISFRPVTLKKLLDRIVQSVMMKAGVEKANTPHPVVLDIPESLPPLWVDSDRLEQILTNLIDNAIKYSEPDKTVTVRAYECQMPKQSDGAINEAVSIDVIDEGIGIAAEHLPKLFTQFYRIESPLTQQVEGTGLGLYIAQSLTKAMDGEIFVDSKAGKGSTFRVIFPVATLEKQAAYNRTRYAHSEPNSKPDQDMTSDEGSSYVR